MNTALLVHDQIPSSTAQEEQTQLPLDARESPRMLRPSDPPMNTALLGHDQIPSSKAVEQRAQLSRHEQAVRSLYELCRLVQHSQQNRKWYTVAVSCDATFITDIRLLIMVWPVLGLGTTDIKVISKQQIIYKEQLWLDVLVSILAMSICFPCSMLSGFYHPGGKTPEETAIQTGWGRRLLSSSRKFVPGWNKVKNAKDALIMVIATPLLLLIELAAKFLFAIHVTACYALLPLVLFKATFRRNDLCCAVNTSLTTLNPFPWLARRELLRIDLQVDVQSRSSFDAVDAHRKCTSALHKLQRVAILYRLAFYWQTLFFLYYLYGVMMATMPLLPSDDFNDHDGNGTGTHTEPDSGFIDRDPFLRCVRSFSHGGWSFVAFMLCWSIMTAHGLMLYEHQPKPMTGDVYEKRPVLCTPGAHCDPGDLLT